MSVLALTPCAGYAGGHPEVPAQPARVIPGILHGRMNAYSPAARIASSDCSAGALSPAGTALVGAVFSWRCRARRTLAAMAAAASKLTLKVRIRPPALEVEAGPAAAAAGGSVLRIFCAPTFKLSTK